MTRPSAASMSTETISAAGAGTGLLKVVATRAKNRSSILSKVPAMVGAANCLGLCACKWLME